jgi:hypothetical protein
MFEHDIIVALSPRLRLAKKHGKHAEVIRKLLQTNQRD